MTLFAIATYFNAIVLLVVIMTIDYYTDCVLRKTVGETRQLRGALLTIIPVIAASMVQVVFVMNIPHH